MMKKTVSLMVTNNSCLSFDWLSDEDGIMCALTRNISLFSNLAIMVKLQAISL